MTTTEKWLFCGAIIAAFVYLVVSLTIIMWNFEQGLAIKQYEIQIKLDEQRGAER